jgi:hypothetical protein
VNGLERAVPSKALPQERRQIAHRAEILNPAGVDPLEELVGTVRRLTPAVQEFGKTRTAQPLEMELPLELER